MPAWTIKSETYDPDVLCPQGALVRDDLKCDETRDGAAVDEQSLKMNGHVEAKRTLLERLRGPAVIAASVFAGFFVLYLVGLWVDH